MPDPGAAQGAVVNAAVRLLDAAPLVEAAQRLADIYEHAPWVGLRACAWRPFGTLDGLKRAMARAVHEAANAERLALVRAHPDLDGRLAHAALAPASRAEQAWLGLDRLEAQALTRLVQLNQAYRSRFGFPFVIAVRGLSGPQALLEAFERRLSHADAATELAVALSEVDRIAAFRLDARFGDRQTGGAP